MTASAQESPNNGHLELGKSKDGVTPIYFVPTEEALEIAGMSDAQPVKMLEVDSDHSIFWIYPIVTLLDAPGEFMTSKYSQIERLGFESNLIGGDPLEATDYENLLESLPSGVSKDFHFGLGLPKPNRPIIQIIETDTNCSEILFSAMQQTHVDGPRFVLSKTDYEFLRLEFLRITSRGQSAALRVKRWQTRSRLAEPLERRPPPLSRGRLEDSKFITDSAAAQGPLSDEDQNLVASLAMQMARQTASEAPEVVAQLRSDLDLVALEALLDSFASALEANKSEPYWQSFFERNPFALHLAFGIPVLTVQNQASVGGRKITGDGDKVVDYLVQNALTGNVGLFEIKRPDELLLRRREHRGGVFGPSKGLTEAITQILDQRYQLSMSLVQLKDTTQRHDLESFSIRCCVVIGKTPTERDQRKSFELFRNSLASVEVVTYDELFVKLQQLQVLLANEG